MKKAEFKQYMLEKGEQVGLYTALGIAGLLLFLTLFMPGRGLFSSSATTKVEALDKEAKSINTKRQSARPGDGPPDSPENLTVESTGISRRFVNRDEYRGVAMVEAIRAQDNKRYPPEILKPSELVATLHRAPLQAVEFEYENVGERRVPTKVWITKGGTGMMGGGVGALGMMGGGMTGSPPNPGAPSGPSMGRGQFGQIGDAFGNRGRPGRPGGAMGGLAGFGGGNAGGGAIMRPPDDNAAKIELVTLQEAEKSKATLAVKVLPRRLIIIEGTFPYHDQVEKFRQAMKLSTHGEVLLERVRGEKKPGKDSKEGTEETWSAFQFRGLDIERMTLAPDGKDTAWEKVPEMLDEYKRIVFWVAKEYEAEDPKLKPIRDVSAGLWVRRPKQFTGARSYPDALAKLSTIKATLEKLEENKDQLITPSRLADEGFNPFDPGQEDQKGGDGARPPTPGGDGVRPPMPGGSSELKPPMPGGDGHKPPAAGMGDDPYGGIAGQGDLTKLKETPILHCMLRFIDPTVEEGKSYRYRIKVKMANPNYSTQPDKRRDTYPDYARKLELTPDDWTEVPGVVVVPRDEHLYVVDQHDIKDGTVFKGKPRDKPVAGSIRNPDGEQVALQIHRWFDFYRPNPERPDEKPVGEWLVADRILVDRGGILRQVYPTEVPVKHLNQVHMELDSHTWTHQDLQKLLRLFPSSYPYFTRSTMPVIFGDDSVLVDFGGGTQTYTRKEKDANPRVKEMRTVVVQDRAPVEVLIQRPDGSVIAHNMLDDATDKERRDRYEAYVKNLESITKKKAGNTGTGTTPGSPFGGGPTKPN